MDDQDVLLLEQRARGGDSAALAEYFHIQRPRLRRVVDIRLDARLRGRVDPSDVLQEAFLDLSKKLSNFVSRERPISMFVWMRLVATERVLQIHRNHFGVEARDVKREVQWQFSGAATSVFLAEQLLVNFGSAEHRVVQEELRAMLVATLDAMEPLDREVITMRFFEELTNGEVAEALGITKNGASSRFVRAMTRLKKDLSNIPGFFD